MKKFITFMLTAVLAITMCMSFGACSPSNTGSNKVKMIDVKLSAEQYGIAVAKTNAGLLESVNELLEEKAEEISALIKTYEGKDYDEEDAATDGTYVEGVVAYENGMSADEYLVLATDYPFAPFEYMVGTNFGGIDIAIGKMIADKLGKKLAVKYISFDLICTAVNGGDADIGLAGLTITEARKQTVNFSAPYYTEAYQVLVVMEDDTTFDNCKT
ncbi:MAG: transporter substrate-binding domain-containing protein, partial [Candidatus Neoclostridium sp.]